MSLFRRNSWGQSRRLSASSKSATDLCAARENRCYCYGSERDVVLRVVNTDPACLVLLKSPDPKTSLSSRAGSNKFVTRNFKIIFSAKITRRTSLRSRTAAAATTGEHLVVNLLAGRHYNNSVVPTHSNIVFVLL